MRRGGADVAVVGLFGGTGDQPVRRMCIRRRLACVRVNMPDHQNSEPTFRSVRQFVRDLRFPLPLLRPDVLMPFTTLPNVLSGIAWRSVGASACVWNQRDAGLEMTFNPWQNLALASTTDFISNSKDGLEFLTKQRGVAASKIRLVYNGVDLPPPLQGVADTLGAVGVSESYFTAVMLANITPFKDHLTLVRAWRIVCDRVGHLKPTLLLAGRKDQPGPVLQEIRRLGLEREVILVGEVADVFELASCGRPGGFCRTERRHAQRGIRVDGSRQSGGRDGHSRVSGRGWRTVRGADADRGRGGDGGRDHPFRK